MTLQSKSDFEKMLVDILNPLRKFFTPEKAGIILGSHATWYDDAAARCESFCRPLWGLVPYFAGGGTDAELQNNYLTGLINGTDPKNAEYFGDCRERDQRFVEMAAIAYAMLLCPDKLWEPLTDAQKNALAAWLSQINGKEVCDSNWIFFRVLVNLAFYRRGRHEFDAERLNKDLLRIDDFYISDGWYSDGVKGQKDYYVSFAIHFYSLVYAKFAEDFDSERAKIYRERANVFAKTFIYWFADDGEALPYGRSLTYRFAQIAFWSACIFADVKPFETDVIKGIITRNLQKWADSNMFDDAHILSVGYKYSNLLMAEHYNAYGSPYWSLKAFIITALPENHEFFTAAPAPMPKLNDKQLIEAADMITVRRSGSVTAYVAGTHEEFGCGQIIPKYLKFAYSTKFGFSVNRSNVSLWELAPDNMLVFCINGVFFERNHSESFEMTDNGFKITWSAFKDIRVETELIITKDGHIRRHTINSPYEGEAYDCGFAVAARDKDAHTAEEGDGFATAKNAFSACTVTGDGKGMVFTASPNTNIMYNKTVIPAIKYTLKKGTTVIETYITEE